MNGFLEKQILTSPLSSMNLLRAVLKCIACLGCLALSFGLSDPADASTITVTSLGDNGGAGQLRAAITTANADGGGDTIAFPSGLSGTIVLNSALPTITQSMTIECPSGLSVAIDGSNKFQIFDIDGGKTAITVAISGIIMQRGYNIGANGGGGILNDGATLTLSDCTLQNNNALNGGGISNSSGTLTLTSCFLSSNGAGTGGAVGQGGGIFNGGTATLTNCTLSENTASTAKGGGGGGILNGASATLTATNCTLSDNSSWDGGGIDSLGTATLQSCTFSENTSDDVGGGLDDAGGTAALTDCTISNNNSVDGGGVYNAAKATITGCSFSENGASEVGGGVDDFTSGTDTMTASTLSGNTADSGGGLAALGTDTLTNCTFSGNSASADGGGISAGTLTLTVTNCTFASNSAPAGQGIDNNTGTTTLVNCILYDNVSGDAANVDGGSVTALHCDIEGGVGGSTAIADEGGNISLDPLFATSGLADNGGPTDTIAIQQSSPCFGSGTEAGAPLTDQRGVERPNPPSIGAYDEQAPSGSVPVPSGLTAVATGATTIKLTWNALAGAATYNLYEGTSPGSETGPISVTAVPLGTAISGLNVNTAYYFQVTAVESAGESARSAEASATTAWISFPAGLNFFSIPSYTYSAEPDAIFGYAGVVLALWNQTTYQYLLTPDAGADTVTNGVGYWARFPQQVDVFPGTAVSTSQNSDIALNAGWNQIGQPFNVQTPVSKLIFKNGTETFAQATAGALIGPQLWAYDQSSNAYVPATSLTPGLAYWIFAYSATDMQVPHP